MRNDIEFVVPAPRAQSRLPQILSADEIVRIIGATRTKKHRVLLMIAHAVGLRVGELVALRVEDIDSDRRMIRVVQGKGMRDRYAPLSPRLQRELTVYWKTSPSSEWVFPSCESHTPIHVRTAQRVFAQAKRRAGVVKSGGIHGLRHAFATHLLEAGTDIYSIQRLLGHRHIASTLRYVHVADGGAQRSDTP